MPIYYVNINSDYTFGGIRATMPATNPSYPLDWDEWRQNYVDLGALLPVPADTIFKVRGVREADGVELGGPCYFTRNGGFDYTIEAWDLSEYGPWRINILSALIRVGWDSDGSSPIIKDAIFYNIEDDGGTYGIQFYNNASAYNSFFHSDGNSRIEIRSDQAGGEINRFFGCTFIIAGTGYYSVAPRLGASSTGAMTDCVVAGGYFRQSWGFETSIMTLNNCAATHANLAAINPAAPQPVATFNENSVQYSWPEPTWPNWNDALIEFYWQTLNGDDITVSSGSYSDYPTGLAEGVRRSAGAFVFDRAPVITIVVDPTSGSAPLEVSGSVDVEFFIPDSYIESYEWDWGDGTVDSEANPSHTYDIPGEYIVTVTVVDNYGNVSTATFTIYVYENDYSAGGRNVTKSTRIYRFGIPQEKKQGTGWSEYSGDNYPLAVGLSGTCKIFTDIDEERVTVVDCNTFKHYWLGREDWWQDGGNAEYGGEEICSDILLREHTPPIEASAKIKHSESHANFKPWYKDRRNTGDYNQFGFRTPFLSSMYFREDSSPEDRAVVKYFPRKAQIVSDRHIESESLQGGLRVCGAPWRLPSVQMWFEQIDTAAAPPEKQMSEKTWAELVESPYVWIGRSIELVNPDTGVQTMPWDNGTNARTTGSFAGVTTGPDGESRSGIVFAAGDSVASVADIDVGDMSIVMWVRSPTTPCVLLADTTIGLTVTLVQTADGWDLQWDDGTNVWTVPISMALTQWVMITVVRRGDVFEVYENAAFANTRPVTAELAYGGTLTFYAGPVTGFEPRIIPAALTADAVEWLYDDVIENSGNSTCAMY